MNFLKFVASAGLILSAGATQAQTAPHDAAMRYVRTALAQGRLCSAALLKDEARPFYQAPSAAVKAVLLLDAPNLKGSDELKQLSEKERMQIFVLVGAAQSCHAHVDAFLALLTGLNNKTLELKQVPKDIEEFAQLQAVHEKAAAAMETVSKASPEAAHFLMVHGALAK